MIGKSFTTDDYEEIIGLVKSSAVIEAVNEDKIEDLNNYIDYLGLSEYEIENFWSEEKADEIKERLGNSYGNIEEFLEDVKEAVCLVKIKYADGYGEVRDVVGAYQELINVRVSEITDDLCRNLHG